MGPECFFPGDESELKYDFEEVELNWHPVRSSKRKRTSELFSVDEEETPEYPDDMKVTPKPIVKGKPFDLISLLSEPEPEAEGSSNYLIDTSNGDRIQVESLRGKYILLCCFFAPTCIDDIYVSKLNNISLLSKELSVRKDFEMVLVPKMKKNYVNDEAAFKQLASAFSCLVVPFHHSSRRDYIWMSLNFDIQYQGILVDPGQIVVQDALRHLLVYGMDAFPFTDERLRYACQLYRSTHSLEGLLGLDVSDFLFKNRPDNEGEQPQRVKVSELKKKLVGLYLCITGEDIPLLDTIHKECQSRNLDFEIVLVNMPFNHLLTPDARHEVIASYLEEMNISWWVLPFNNSVSRMLYSRSHADFSDRLFIVSDKLVDPNGEIVVRNCGIHGYPFTRESVVLNALEKVRQHTLESLLGSGFLYYRNDKSAPVSVSDLQGKTILLFLDRAEHPLSRHRQLTRNYFHIKEKHPDFELVFVCLDSSISNLAEQNLSSMPWLVYPSNPYKSEMVVKALSIAGIDMMKLIAFDKDGRISSINVEHFQYSHVSDASSFSGNLPQQITYMLNNEIKHFLSHMVWSDSSFNVRQLE